MIRPWRWCVHSGKMALLDVSGGGDVLRHFSKARLMANVSIYWLTQSINASNRYYYEGKHTRWPGTGESSTVPHGVTLNAQRNERPPRSYVERIFECDPLEGSK